MTSQKPFFAKFVNGEWLVLHSAASEWNFTAIAPDSYFSDTPEGAVQAAIRSIDADITEKLKTAEPYIAERKPFYENVILELAHMIQRRNRLEVLRHIVLSTRAERAKKMSK